MTAPVRPTSETSAIPAAQAGAFRAWLARNGVDDLDHPDSHYDYRGAFLAGVNRGASMGHWPDTFKQHGHPTFSVESQYSLGPEDGGRWENDRFIPSTPTGAPMPAKKKGSITDDDEGLSYDGAPAAKKKQSVPPARRDSTMAQRVSAGVDAALAKDDERRYQATGGRFPSNDDLKQFDAEQAARESAARAGHQAQEVAVPAAADGTAVRPPGSSPGGDAAAVASLSELPAKYGEYYHKDAEAFDAAGGPAGQIQRLGDHARHAAEAIDQGATDLMDAMKRRAARHRRP